MGKIKKLKDVELVGGTEQSDVYPITSTKAIYDENNKRLDSIISELQKSADSSLETENKTIVGSINELKRLQDTGYLFKDVATPTTDPGTPKAKVFYIANGKGTYTNFSGIEVTEDDVVILYWDSSWHKVSTGIPSQEKLTEVINDVGKFPEIIITKAGDYPFIASLKKGDFISMEVKSSSSQVAYYVRNKNNDDILFLYGGHGYVEKQIDKDFNIDHIYVLNSNGEKFSSNIKIRLNHDGQILSNRKKTNIAYNKVYFANCDSAADSPEKIINIDGFDQLQDCRIIARMSHSNTANSPKLKVGNSPAMDMRYNEEQVNKQNSWEDNEIIDIFYATTDLVYRTTKWSKNDKIIFTYKDIKFEQGTLEVPTSNANVYAKLGQLKEGKLHIAAKKYFLMEVKGYSDAMYQNIVSDTDWQSTDIDIDVNSSLYYTITMLYDWHIADNPYKDNLHPSDVNWFSYSIALSGDISSQVTKLIQRVDVIDDRFKEIDVPDFYKEHIAEKCAEIIKKDQDYGFNGDSFIFITDTHVEVNYGHSASLIREILKATGKRLVINGGDVIDANCAKDECAQRAKKWFSQFGDIHQFVSLGNHDYNTKGEILKDPSYDLSANEMYGIYMKQNEYFVMNDNKKNYYYIDNKTQKIRYYILDIHYYKDTDYKGNNLEIDNQLEWLERTALEIGSEWTILVIYHIHFISAVVGAYGVVESATRNALAKRLMDKVDTLIDRQGFPTVAGFICGHTHRDMYDLSTKGYPIISFDCDASYNYDEGGYDKVWSPLRAKGTINEQSFNVIHIDKENKKLLITRIGYKRDDPEHPVKLEFSYNPNTPNQADYFPINDVQ